MNYNIQKESNSTMKALKLVVLLLVIAYGYSSAQMFDKTDKQDKQSNSSVPSAQSLQQTIKTPIQDGPVDPKEYIVGPGDVFNVSIWANTPLSFQVPVTPEGSVIIPTVGEVMVSGKRLDSAKQLVLKEIKKKYITGIPSFTLLFPRTFAVTLKGAVREEGTFYVQATQRVDAVVNFSRPDQQRDTTVAQRKIVVRHKDGTRNYVDIEKYFLNHDNTFNPLLQDGDIIIVPYRNIEKDFISLYGAVNRQGKYEFVEGDSLLTMLRIARGLAALADSDRVVISRSTGSHTQEHFTVSVRNIKAGKTSDVPLQRGDRIVVYEHYIPFRDAKVYVEGEVRFPGYYPVSKDSTRLSEVLERAGGITEFASLKNSQLFRRSVNWYEIAVERLESARGGITPDDSAYYYLETDIRINRELVVTDFSAAIENKKSDKDIFLRDGDFIQIAAKKKTVYVFGQVIYPGHIIFTPNRDFQSYINQAGGLTEYARKGDIKIIKAATRQWLSPDETTIEDGDYVWVPKEPYRPFTYYLTVYSQVFGIIATTVSLILLTTR